MSNTSIFRQKIAANVATNGQKNISASKLRAALEEGANAIDTIFETFSLTDGLGTYNATTGVANVKETGETFTPVPVSTRPNGKYFDVVVAGTQSITGVSVAMEIGGIIISRGTKWDYIPKSSLALTRIIATESKLSKATIVENILPNSETFSAWTPTAILAIGAAVAGPDGILNAVKIVEDSTTAQHLATSPAFNVTTGTRYQISFVVKQGERTTMQIQLANTGRWTGGVTPSMNLDLAGAIVSLSSNVVNPTVIDIGGSWRKVTFSVDCVGTGSTNIRVYIGTSSYLGNGASGIFLNYFQVSSIEDAKYVATGAAGVTAYPDQRISQTEKASWNSKISVVGNANILRNAVSKDQTLFFTPAKNKLDVSTVVEGSAVNNSGALVVAAGYAYAEILGIEAGQQYTYSGTMQDPRYAKIRFEDINGAFISLFNPDLTGILTLPFSFTAPAGAVKGFANIKCGGTSSYGTLQIEKGAAATTYEAYGRKIAEVDMNLASFYNRIEADAKFITPNTAGKNKLDVSQVVEGSAVHNSGSIITAAGYAICPVTVKASQLYTLSGTIQFDEFVKIRFENAAGGLISVYNASSANFTDLPASFTTPALCVKVWINVKTGGTASYGTIQLEEGGAATVYEAFANKIDPARIDLTASLSKAIFLPLKGKKVIFFGDSITVQNLFQPFVQSVHEFTYVNNGVSGSCIATGKEDVETDLIHRDALITRLTAVNALAGDVIFVFAGTNDGYYNVPIGTISDAVTTTFYGALKTLITNLQANNVAKKIVFATPLPRGNSRTSGAWQKTNIGLAAYPGQKAYADAIKDVCGQYGVPVLDLFSRSGFTYENISQFTSDNTHPNSVGAPFLAKIVTNFLFNI
jgi:lysophospholipase L1-like esterase